MTRRGGPLEVRACYDGPCHPLCSLTTPCSFTLKDVPEVLLAHIVAPKRTFSGVDGVGFEGFVFGGVLHDHNLVLVALGCVKLATKDLREDHLGRLWHEGEVCAILLHLELEHKANDLRDLAVDALLYARGATTSHHDNCAVFESDSGLEMESGHLVLLLHIVKSLLHQGVVGLASIGKVTVHEVHDLRLQVELGVEIESEHGLILPVARQDGIVPATGSKFRWVQPFFILHYVEL